MKKGVLAFALMVGVMSAYPQPFQQFIRTLYDLPIASRQAKADSFVHTRSAFPYIENDTVCHFIYSGEGTSVSVAGDFTGWIPDPAGMTRIAGTSFWYKTKGFEKDARLDYKFVVDKQNWILDPKNPATCLGGFGINSELRMPGYVRSAETEYQPGTPQGTIIDTIFSSTLLGNSRAVKIYLPQSYDKGTTGFPLVLFHDGLGFVSLANACTVLDNLIAKKEIRPVVAVFVAPVDREAEYAGDRMNLYVSFIAGELMAAVAAGWNITNDPHERASIGISNGGNISLYLGVMHPEIAGNIAALSSNVVPEVVKMFAKSNQKDLQLYLDMGTYDIPELIPMADRFTRLLDRAGYQYTFLKWHEGHSWGSWKAHMGLALRQFFPPVDQP